MNCQVYDIEPVEFWSCELCQKATDKPYMWDKKKFCSYKHAWHFMWRRLYGWFTSQDGIKITLTAGMDDESIKVISLELCPEVFSKIKYERRNWCFQLTKILMERWR